MKSYLKEKETYVNELLKDSLKEIKYPSIMREGMEYALLSGGKRIRPILLLMTLEMLGIDPKKGDGFAIAIEMIHTYSLVHDDLPAIDNDDYRRGKLTSHKKFGEANGILIGDSLLTYAFYILSHKNNGLDSDRLLKLVQLTSKYSGVQGMIGGQVIDIESENKEIDLPTLQYIHTHKTGMLIRLPIEGASIIAKCNEREKKALIEYADLIGLAFQIKDDILDIEGKFEETGKVVGSDEKLHKATYPSIFGLEKTKEMLDEKINEAISIIEENFPKKATKLVHLAKYIRDRKK